VAVASDFNVGSQLGFAKVHHKITPKGKSGGGLGLGQLIYILEFPYNISATALLALAVLLVSLNVIYII